MKIIVADPKSEMDGKHVYCTFNISWVFKMQKDCHRFPAGRQANAIFFNFVKP